MSGTDASQCGGGYNSVSGSIAGSLNLTQNGISHLGMNMTLTPVNCGTGGWVLSGNPYLSMTATVTVTGSIASLSGTGPSGGWTASQNGTSVSCLIQFPPAFNASGQHGGMDSTTIICNDVSTTIPGFSY